MAWTPEEFSEKPLSELVPEINKEPRHGKDCGCIDCFYKRIGGLVDEHPIGIVRGCPPHKGEGAMAQHKNKPMVVIRRCFVFAYGYNVLIEGQGLPPIAVEQEAQTHREICRLAHRVAVILGLPIGLAELHDGPVEEVKLLSVLETALGSGLSNASEENARDGLTSTKR